MQLFRLNLLPVYILNAVSNIGVLQIILPSYNKIVSLYKH